ncbi:enoyl-CoA hydratase [Ferruginivarius sediminum]|uniref:Enoyl-CoA hydratase n=1 Tax=Ferruginivarius sediminum TaxID=2661937 RepID=A0A369T534_9PROT|nr:enoyl-CoA hydratase [Ferruginivarius sediminum]RDD60429.1 enoyl-CoA hydratase [Ferruginivarius sediminum]
MSDYQDTVLLERPEEHVALVRLNRPKARNALNMQLRQRLAEVFQELSADTDVRCVVITGNEEAFAAGADIRDMVDTSAVEMYLRHTERLWRAVSDCPHPVISAVNGYALGGGLELALNTDIIIAGEGAKLGQPEVRVGIMPGAGGTQRLARTIGKYQTMRLTLTGEIISAQEAFSMGFVSKVVPDAEVLETALSTARTIASMPPLAVEQIKEVVVHGPDASLEGALLMERKALQVLFASDDKVEGMKAFLEKRKPSFSGR